ncbi:MAG: PRC-barrel domain-containing protein [Candidatus Methanoplasma sp.]|jgi:sporulation protein YlmC with PRC-barrel domain|nr:PRC-barrel domain-containing protein [Candidatus Methanoplasma sp.]
MGNRIFSTELFGKEVVTIAGTSIGIIEDCVVDTDRGSIKYLLVSTGGNVISEPHKVDENGRLVVETDRIRIDGNRLVIN